MNKAVLFLLDHPNCKQTVKSDLPFKHSHLGTCGQAFSQVLVHKLTFPLVQNRGVALWHLEHCFLTWLFHLSPFGKSSPISTLRSVQLNTCSSYRTNPGRERAAFASNSTVVRVIDATDSISWYLPVHQTGPCLLRSTCSGDSYPPSFSGYPVPVLV